MPTYYEAHVPEPFRILGQKLKPLSLGHRILLQRIESAYIIGGTFSIDDLVASVFICSRTYEEGLDALDDPDVSKFMLRWWNQLTKRSWWKFWEKRPQVDFHAKSKLFEEYVEAHTQEPGFKFEPEAGGKSNDCPLELQVKLVLHANTNLSESEILNRSWALCLWEYIAIISRMPNSSVTMIDADAYADAKKRAEELAKCLSSQ